MIKNTNLTLVKTEKDLHQLDPIARDGIVRVQADSQLSVTSLFPTIAIHWAGFRMDTLLNPLVFVYALSTVPSVSARLVAFNKILLIDGIVWNASDSQFVVPLKGIYYFSISSSIHQHSGTSIDLNINGACEFIS